MLGSPSGNATVKSPWTSLDNCYVRERVLNNKNFEVPAEWIKKQEQVAARGESNGSRRLYPFVVRQFISFYLFRPHSHFFSFSFYLTASPDPNAGWDPWNWLRFGQAPFDSEYEHLVSVIKVNPLPKINSFLFSSFSPPIFGSPGVRPPYTPKGTHFW